MVEHRHINDRSEGIGYQYSYGKHKEQVEEGVFLVVPEIQEEHHKYQQPEIEPVGEKCQPALRMEERHHRIDYGISETESALYLELHLSAGVEYLIDSKS